MCPRSATRGVATEPRGSRLRGRARVGALTIPRGRVFARKPADRGAPGTGAPKGQPLPGTSQAPGPCGSGNSEVPAPPMRRDDRGGGESDDPVEEPPVSQQPVFADRHVGPRPDDVARMLDRVGFDSLDDLMAAAVPPTIASRTLDLPEALSEYDAARELRRLAALNRPAESMIGLGYHATITPGVIRRNVLEDPSWYTAYTPYQPEISQGRLEALLNFQTVVGDLTGLPTANASLLDEGTAAAEAMTLVRRAKRTASG